MKLWVLANEQKPNEDGWRRTKFLVVRNTYPQLEQTTVKTWLEWFPEEVYGRFYWSKPLYHRLLIGRVDMEVYFLALDRADDVRNLRSLEATGFWINEGQYMPKELFDEMDSRVGRFPPPKDGGASWAGIIMDMNEPSEDHWLALMMGEVPFPEDWTPEQRVAFKRPKNWWYGVQPPALVEKFGPDGKTVVGYAVNPAAENQNWLPPGYYRDMVPGKSKAWIDSRLMNRISIHVDGRAVWPMFNVETHVAKEPLEAVEGWPLILGVDFGRSPAVVAGQCINGRWRILWEFGMTNVGATTFAPELKRELERRFRGFQVELWGDPKGADRTQAGEQTAYDVFRAVGLPVRPAPVPGNNIRIRLEAVENALNAMRDGSPRLLISPNCRALKIAMAGGYHYKKVQGTSRYHEVPEKNRSADFTDALQYLLLGGGEARSVIGLDVRGPAKPVVGWVPRKSLRRVG